MHDKFFTVAEVAERYSVSLFTVYAWIRKKQLKAVRFGRRCVRVPAEALEAFENERIF